MSVPTWPWERNEPWNPCPVCNVVPTAMSKCMGPTTLSPCGHVVTLVLTQDSNYPKATA